MEQEKSAIIVGGIGKKFKSNFGQQNGLRNKLEQFFRNPFSRLLQPFKSQ